MNAAQLMIKCLENEGVKYIFGVPGEENEDFLFALEKSSIEFIIVRHEQGAALMANVWGRLTGKAGVCLSTLGPGATNLMTGIADANLDKAPMVALTGQGGSGRLHHESHQIINIVDMMSHITKWNGAVQNYTIIPEMVRKAFKLAEAEKPGATHIELSEDIAKLEISDVPGIVTRRTVRRPSADQWSVEQAVGLIESAKKPLIIAGNGAIRTRSSDALTAFSQKFNIPVASTFMGKGAISNRTKQSLGAVGLGFKDYNLEALEEADLVITIGYDIAEYNPKNWNESGSTKIIHIDFEQAEVYQHYNPTVEIIGDLAQAIELLSSNISNSKFEDWYVSIKQRMDQSIASYQLAQEANEFNTPGVIDLVRKHLPDDGLLISDVGSHKMWIARNYPTYCPNGCIISNGLASMGIALPGGVAAHLVDLSRPVVSIMGDGGALMNIQELETAKRLGVATTFIVLNDNQYGLIKWKQEMSEGKSFGTKLGNPDFVQLAQSFGIQAFKPDSVSELEDILKKCINGSKVSLIEIAIDVSVNDELIAELDNYFSK